MKARTAGNDEIAQAQQRIVILPRRNLQKRIRAEQKIKMHACAVEIFA